MNHVTNLCAIRKSAPFIVKMPPYIWQHEITTFIFLPPSIVEGYIRYLKCTFAKTMFIYN